MELKESRSRLGSLVVSYTQKILFNFSLDQNIRHQINDYYIILLLFQENPYSQLYFLETSPTFCSVTRGRQCQHPGNCATLCCGRGYDTYPITLIEKCRCRFTNGRCCQVVCDLCEKKEFRYYCK